MDTSCTRRRSPTRTRTPSSRGGPRSTGPTRFIVGEALAEIAGVERKIHFRLAVVVAAADRFALLVFGMIYGYARVSTAAQDESGQVAQLKTAGCQKVHPLPPGARAHP